MEKINAILITEKQNLTPQQKEALIRNSILLDMGANGLLSADREHSNLKFYIKSAIQIAHFYGNAEVEKKLKSEISNLK